MSVEALNEYLVEIILPSHNIIAKGIVYCEGSSAYNMMMDREGLGHAYECYGSRIESKYKEFNRIGHGIGLSIGETVVSIIGGTIDGVGVLFVHPTSVIVNHEEVEKFFKENYPNFFFVEYDQNFDGKYSRKLSEAGIFAPEVSEEYINMVLKDKYAKFSKISHHGGTVGSFINDVMNSMYKIIEYPVSIDMDAHMRDVIISNNATHGIGTYNFFHTIAKNLFDIIKNYNSKDKGAENEAV